MKKLVIVIVAVLGLAAIGGGLFAVLDKDPASVVIDGTTINLPEGYPEDQGTLILSLGAVHENSKTSEYIYVYSNRTVIVLEDYDQQSLRICKSSLLSQDEFNGLTSLISSQANNLQPDYAFEGYGESGTQLNYGDMDVSLSINYKGIIKTVKAANYLSRYSDYAAPTYAGMSSPLADICKKLNDIQVKTAEISRGSITTTASAK